MTKTRNHSPTEVAIYRDAWVAGLRGDPPAISHRVPARRDAYLRGWQDGRAVAMAGREFHRALAAGEKAIALGIQFDHVVGRPACAAGSSLPDEYCAGSFIPGG
jgi:hypothetical protein